MSVYLKRTETGLELSGYLTSLDLSQLKIEGIRALLPFTHCIVDCKELVQVNSAGLALFLSWLGYAKKQGKTLVFSKMQLAVRAMVDLYCLDKILIFQD